jgi:tetratricopeptide (TPR) repeat protein
MLETSLPTEARVLAEWALGIAERETGNLDTARHHLESAMARADTAGLDQRSAQVRDSLVFTLALQGDNEAALHQADLAEPHLSGAALARLQMQKGLVLQRLGRGGEAMASYAHALPGIQDAGDKVAEVRLRVNRSVLSIYRSAIGEAIADLETATQLATEMGNTFQMGACAHNLGFARGRAGDVPGALEAYAAAADAYASAGVEAGLAAVLEADRADLLLAAGLTEEAFAGATRGAELLTDTGNAADLAEVQLLAARAALADGRITQATSLAAEAGASFLAQGRHGWHALASYVSLQARFAPLEGSASASRADLEATADEAQEVARRLSTHGWDDEARHACIIAARCVLNLDDRDTARRLLEEAGAALRRGPVTLRARAWHATALLRAVNGDVSGARRAISTGLRLLDEYRATLGATELRVSAASHGQDLSRLGVALALQDGDARRLLGWADRSRAGAIRLRPVHPPADETLAADLAELRRLEREIADAVLADRPDPTLRRRQAELQGAVRRRARTHQGSASASTRLDVAMLRKTLGARTLVEFIDYRGRLHAVTAGPRGYGHHELGAVEPLRELIEIARFDLHRLAHSMGSAMALDAAAHSLSDVGSRLDDLLLGPLHLDHDASLVLVPTGPLHGVPWRTLPQLLSASFVVAPSAQQWLAATTSREPATTALYASGPGLPSARAEVEDLGRRHPGSRRISGGSATAERVLEALGDTDVAHIAAHGEFRADNPMFSSLLMADGRITVYDMERLETVPQTIVLPACDAAVSGVKAGDELLGLSAALLGMGVRTLVVPQVPIPDAATRELMLAFHGAFRVGADAATALATSIESLADGDPQSHAVRRSFVVLGA